MGVIMKIIACFQLIHPAIKTAYACLARYRPTIRFSICACLACIGMMILHKLIPDGWPVRQPALEIASPEYFQNEFFGSREAVMFQHSAKHLLFCNTTPP